MDCELLPLCKVLHFYKNSFLQTFDKIEESVIGAIHRYQNAQPQESLTKQMIATEIISILSIYIRYLHNFEKLGRYTSAKFPYAEDSRRKRECSNSAETFNDSEISTNPFDIGLEGEIEQILNDVSVKSPLNIEENIEIPIKTEKYVNTEKDNVNNEIVATNTNQTDVIYCNIIKPKKSDTDQRQFSGIQIIPIQNRREDNFENFPEASDHDTSTDTITQETIGFQKTDSNISNNDNNEPNKNNSLIMKKDIHNNNKDYKELIRNIKLENNDDTIDKDIGVKKVMKETETEENHSTRSEQITQTQRKPTPKDRRVSLASNVENNCESRKFKGTAVEKLRTMPHYDWREELVKKHEIESLKKTLRYESIRRPIGKSDRKPKERKILEIMEGHLEVGQTCVICHVESPSEFYVRSKMCVFEQFEELFNNQMNETHHYVVNKYKSKAEAQYNLGNYCLGYHSDRRKWYRLEILDWMTDEEDEILVQLVDYGEKLYWDYQCVKAMSELHTIYNKMAIKCHLGGIYSPFLTVWSNESVQFFIEISEMTEMTEFLVSFVMKEGSSYAVDLQRNDNPNSEHLAELLVNNNYAFEVEVSEAVPSDDEDLQIINTFITNDDESNKIEISKNLSPPVVGQEIRILITGYINSCHFYVHILDVQTGDNPFNDDFQEFQETMQTNNLVQRYEMFDCAPKTGELVLVKDSTGVWLRGRCLDCTGDEEFQIFLVDFGGQMKKKIGELRRMEKDFLSVPFQAVECILYSKELETVEMNLSLYETAYRMKVFKARVVESGEPLQLQLWDDNI